jgi:hypothetical protein
MRHAQRFTDVPSQMSPGFACDAIGFRGVVGYPRFEHIIDSDSPSLWEKRIEHFGECAAEVVGFIV